MRVMPGNSHFLHLCFTGNLLSALRRGIAYIFVFADIAFKARLKINGEKCTSPIFFAVRSRANTFLCTTNTCRTAFRRNGYDFFNLFWRKPDLFCRIHRTLPVKARYLLLAAARSAGNRGIAVAYRRIDLATSRADGYYLPLPDIIGNGTIKHRRNAFSVHALSDAQIRAPFDNKRQHIVYYMSLRQNVFIFDFLR